MATCCASLQRREPQFRGVLRRALVLRDPCALDVFLAFCFFFQFRRCRELNPGGGCKDKSLLLVLAGSKLLPCGGNAMEVLCWGRLDCWSNVSLRRFRLCRPPASSSTVLNRLRFFPMFAIWLRDFKRCLSPHLHQQTKRRERSSPIVQKAYGSAKAKPRAKKALKGERWKT